MKVTLVLRDVHRGWVIEKLTMKLCEALQRRGVLAEVRSQPSPDAQINHLMFFDHVGRLPKTINTVSVTHIDDALHADMVKTLLSRGVRAAICFSSMTANQLAGYGIDRARLTYALPALDGGISPRRIVIGITSNRPGDGRKREWMLVKLAEDVALDDFEFRIFGFGWSEVARVLEAAGAKVVITEASEDRGKSYEEVKAAVPHFDYYLYPGLDEGSLGTLDALAAGIKTIVTLQGFHLDLPNSITHGFWHYPELRKIFEAIAAERRARILLAQSLTWDRYAQRHIDIWSGLLGHDALPPDDRVGDGERYAAPAEYDLLGYRAIIADPYRRQVALRFWIPRLYQAYLITRHRLARLAQVIRA